MRPGVENWKKNASSVKRNLSSLNADTVIARGPFATWLALEAKKSGIVKRVVFDGRGAYSAEFREYNVAGSSTLNTEIEAIEKRAVLESDFRIAVSKALAEYWQRTFGYSETEHQIIPCTLRTIEKKETDLQAVRKRFGFAPEDIVIVYSGSFAGWQSFDLLDKVGIDLLEKQKSVKFLVLAPDTATLKMAQKYPDRVVCTWLSSKEVHAVLNVCDYGWMVREETITNLVASPVKFAEYLAAGLPVIISKNLGDFSAFVRHHKAGFVAEGVFPELAKTSEEERNRFRQLAETYLTKKAFTEQYKIVAG